MRRSFIFPARVDEVPRYAHQVLAALGDGFDASLVLASISEALLNAVIYGALQVSGRLRERDPVEFVSLIRVAEKRSLGQSIAVQVGKAADEPLDMLVHIRDPGPGFDWRAQLQDLADASATFDAAKASVSTSGRGLSIMLAGARSVLWNDSGNEVTLRFRPRGAPPATSRPPAPLRLTVPSSTSLGATGRRTTTTGRFGLEPATPAVSDSERILVVDDSDVNSRVLQRMLEWEGFEVRSVRDGKAAIQEVRSWKPELVVMDVFMPGITGIEAVRQLRDMGLLQQTSVLLLTAAYVDDSIRSAGIDAGASDFLEKPISRRELVARIRRQLSTQRSFRQLEVERASLHDTVNAAAHVMEALMPAPRIVCDSAIISTLVIPSHFVGGDVVDFMQLSPHHWSILLIDVAGHGLAAALTASASRAILRDHLADKRNVVQAVSALNARLSEDFDRTGQHAAVVAVLVDEQKASAHILNAGCPPVAVFTRNGMVHLVPSSATPTGLLKDTEFKAECFDLHELARIVVVSDGITEGFSTPSETLEALHAVCGTGDLVEMHDMPVERVRLAIDQLGPERDDASIAWLNLMNFASDCLNSLSEPFFVRERRR